MALRKSPTNIQDSEDLTMRPKTPESTLRIAMAQLNFLVGDIEGNAAKVLNAAHRARDQLKSHLIVFPEMTLTGYPPEDLLIRPELYQRLDRAMQQLTREINGIMVVVGHPGLINGQRFNQASVLHQGHLIATYSKQKLPNYGVFDEMRYFHPGQAPCVLECHELRFAITLCEDLWYPEPMAQAKKAGAQLMLSLNASPFRKHKPRAREQVMAERAKEGKMPIIYVNLVGGQDELVFDGSSMVLSADGDVRVRGPFCQEALVPVEINTLDASVGAQHIDTSTELSTEARLYEALVLGVRDYIEKNNFPKALVGVSGGIDSALTLAIAVDALGKDRVEAILMPSRYTSTMSIKDAQQQADALGVNSRVLSIEPSFKAFLETLAPEFSGLPEDSTEENIQARCRGVLLMALSNKMGVIVLSTGNKSEMSVGYSTLYGDMVGGFCVLKDVPKTWVYQLARYRNTSAPIIPERVLTRAPSAELAYNQTDQDTLPPYEELDAILERYVERDESIETIIAAGFEEKTVKDIAYRVDHNEYKRRQAPIGVRITPRAFGRDRRYPVTMKGA